MKKVPLIYLGEKYGENKVQHDGKYQNSVHNQVHSDIGFVLPIKFFYSFKHYDLIDFFGGVIYINCSAKVTI